MAGSIDLVKVKEASEALAKLNRTEVEFLKTYLVMSGRKAAADAIEPEAKKPERKHDPRGHYKCKHCGKILPTKRGRAIHERGHEREAAPAPEAKP